MRFLLDTNICIYIRQKKSPEIRTRLSRLEPGDAGISIISYGELLFGAQKSGERERSLRALDEFVTLVTVLPLPHDAAAAYGEIRADLERAGQIIGNNDLWIAAHARAAQLVLVTNNEREFRRIPSLRIENWVR